MTKTTVNKRKPLQLTITQEQALWVDNEAKRTGDAKTAVIRKLIQQAMETSK